MTVNRRSILKAGTITAISLSLPATVLQDGAAQDTETREVPTKSEQGKSLPLAKTDPAMTTLLMFAGQAEAAMKYYSALFENSKIVEIARYGPGELGKEGTVKMAMFSLNGQRLMCIDSPLKHDFTFTPATSLYVSSADEEKIARYFETLAQGGKVLMPLDKYEFSRRFGWVQDQFGVSWQLSAQ